MKYKTIDLFAGIGGIRKGFELTGYYENILSAENDLNACKTYQHLFQEDPFNDVTTEEFKTKVTQRSYDILLAGFPCQAFSRAGKQEGFLDQTRGTLFFDIADILVRTRPKAFLLENVDNLCSHDKGKTFKLIIDTLVKELNYKIVGVKIDPQGEISYSFSSFKRNSRHFGVPQNRPRVYIMGFDKSHYESLAINNLPDELPSKRIEQPIYNDLNELLEFKASPEYYIASKYLDTLKKHRERHTNKGNGFGYIVVNEPGIDSPVSNAILATGGSGKERNLVHDPQDGIAGLMVGNKKSPLNSEDIRFMTPREWGKLQGFINYAFVENNIDHFSFPVTVSKGQQYKQFGNAVTIPVIEELAKFMHSCLLSLDEAKSTTEAVV